MVVALEPVIVLTLLLACAVLIALSFAYRATFGALLGELAKLGSVSIGVRHIGSIHPLRPLADAADAIDNTIRHALGTAIGNTEWALNRALQWLAYSVQWVGRAIGDLADDVDRAFAHMLAHTVPQVAQTITNKIVQPVLPVVEYVRTVTHGLAKGAMARVTALEKRLAHLTRAVSLAAAGAVAIPFPRIRRVEREAAASRQWIARHAKLLTASGIVGLIGATIFKHFKLGWLRCKGVNRVGHSLCGMSGLIESLFADALDVLLVTNLCQLTMAMERGARAFEPELAYIVSLTDGLAKCRGTKPARPLPVRRYDPPPVSASIAV